MHAQQEVSWYIYISNHGSKLIFNDTEMHAQQEVSWDI